MSETEGNDQARESPRITRRRLLRWASALAVPAALGSGNPVAAGPIPPDGDYSWMPPRRRTAPVDLSDIPLRSVEEAVNDCAARRQSAEKGGDPSLTPLNRLLADTPLADSRLGLANWHLQEESEGLGLGHFTFPVSPYTTVADDGKQRFLLLSNTNLIANFRSSHYLEETHRRMFDRAAWAMANGGMGTAILEFDRTLTAQKVVHIVRLLSQYGVKTLVWGNEPNSPYAPWRDNLPEVFRVFTAANEARRQYALEGMELSTPGLAYYGQGEYLQRMLQAFKEMQRQRGPGDPARNLPVQRVSDHFYGPVEELLPRLSTMRQIMAKEGLNHLKFDLTEVGSPTIGIGQPVGDEQLAEGFIHQVAALAVASGMVDRFYYYSYLGSVYEDSLVEVRGTGLAPKSSYRSFLTACRLLARLNRVLLSEEREFVRVEGIRSDGINFVMLWSKVPDRELSVPVPVGAPLFDALGQEVKESRPGQVTLKPKQLPYLAGPVRIAITRRP